MTGEERYQRIIHEARKIAKFELEQFMAGEIAVLPCSGDRERAMIIAELDKIKEE